MSISFEKFPDFLLKWRSQFFSLVLQLIFLLRMRLVKVLMSALLRIPEMVIKEIGCYLLAYNLIRLLMMQAAILAGILPREISFKHSLQLWLIWSRQTNTSDNHMLWVVCELMAQQRVGNRSGRIEPRAVKRRPKPYPSLVVPRGQMREHVKK
jgi:hypothetical protein